jgi:hypothetical protein
MLLQTHAYTVPRDRREQHARLMKRLQDAMRRLGGHFEVYEQVGPGFDLSPDPTGRFVQVMRFKDRRHLAQVQQAERNDAVCQALLIEFCQLVDYSGQLQGGSFVPGYYAGVSVPESTQTPPGVAEAPPAE